MPFAPFRDRLGSGSKHDHSTISRSSTQSSEGNTLDKTASSSSHVDTSPSNSAALQALIAQPLSADPVQFVQDALTPLFTYNSKHHTLSLSDVLEHHVPRYFAPHYRHSFNLTEADLLGKSRALRDPIFLECNDVTCHKTVAGNRGTCLFFFGTAGRLGALFAKYAQKLTNNLCSDSPCTSQGGLRGRGWSVR